MYCLHLYLHTAFWAEAAKGKLQIYNKSRTIKCILYNYNVAHFPYSVCHYKIYLDKQKRFYDSKKYQNAKSIMCHTNHCIAKLLCC